MVKEYLTIKEACDITGKSNITIRRLIKKLQKPDVKKKKVSTGFIYLISKDFLTTQLITQEPIHLTTQKDKNDVIQAENQTTQLITQLTTQNDFLREQIKEKDKQIGEINNRLKESNVINMALQTRLSLPDKKPNIFTRLFFKQKDN